MKKRILFSILIVLMTCGGVLAYLMFRTPKRFIEFKEIINSKSYNHITAHYGMGSVYELSEQEAEELCSIIKGGFEEEWTRKEGQYGGVTCVVWFKAADGAVLSSINVWDNRVEITYDSGKHLVNEPTGSHIYAYMKTLISELP